MKKPFRKQIGQWMLAAVVACVGISGGVCIAGGTSEAMRAPYASGVIPIQYYWSTFAGNPLASGSSDGLASAAGFSSPGGITMGGDGNLYVADQLNSAVRKVTPAGYVTTLSANVPLPLGIVADPSGNLFVTGDNTIQMITPGGIVSTLAGQAGVSGSSDGTGTTASFGNLPGIAMDLSGNIFVADQGNHTIRKVTRLGVVSTIAGSPGISGSTDGVGSGARFNSPTGVALDAAGNVYVADGANNAIRKITPVGVVTTLAGSLGVTGFADGTGSAARFSTPFGISCDGGGNLYVADSCAIRKVTIPAGVVTTIGGVSGVSGSANGIGAAARFSGTASVAVSPVGIVYVADAGNNRISLGSFVGTGVVAASYDPAPGTFGALFTTFGGSEINDLGIAAFRGILGGGDAMNAYNNMGIWYGSSVALSLIARTGQLAPGVLHGIFSYLHDPVFNLQSQTAFMGWLQTGGKIRNRNANGIWSNAGGPLALIARADSQAPGTEPGAKFSSFSKLVMPNYGRLMILGNLAHGSGGVNKANDQGIWVGTTARNLKLILRKGRSVRIGGRSKTVASFTALDTPAGEARGYNSRGTLVARVKFTDNQQAVVTVSQSGVLTAVAWKNGGAPGIGNGKFSSFGTPAINDAGRTAFRATVVGRGIGSLTNVGIWSTLAKTPVLIARKGMTAPGTTQTFKDFSDPVSNNYGQVAFTGMLAPGVRGLWANTSGSLSLVALTNSQAADAPQGTLFLTFDRLALPHQGGAIFLATLKTGSAGVSRGNNQGIWAVDTTGQLHLVVRSGASVLVRGKLKIIAGLSIFNSSLETTAQTGSYDNSGDVVYKAAFTDGSEAIFEVIFL